MEQKIAEILNIFLANLRAQYILSTEPTGAIPIALTSQADLVELHERLVPLVVPPRNTNGSISKRKMREVLVKVTDKSDDVSSSSGNGKVRRRLFPMICAKKISRRRTRAESDQIQPPHRMTCMTKGLPSARQFGPTGSVKHTPLERGQFRAGGMALQLNVSLSLKMTSTFGLSYMYVFSELGHIRLPMTTRSKI